MTTNFRPLAHFYRLLQHLIPTQCRLCARTLILQSLCDACLNSLPWQKHTCTQCGIDLETDDSFCGHCLTDPPAFTQSTTPFKYEAPLSYLITRFKYHHDFAAGQELSDLLCEHLAHESQENSRWQKPDLLIPVPIHWRKRWSRGFNQAEFIAKPIAKRLNIPLQSKIIQVKEHQHSQKGLNRENRQKNLRGKFSIKEKNLSLIQGKHLVLIDDVVTTTATVRELSQVLIKAGAGRVDVWALARTPELK